MANRGRWALGSVLGIAAGGLLILGIASYFSLYRVAEWETALVIQFGEVRGDPVTEPGLHVKLPWQRVRRYDNRLLRWDGQETSTITNDRKTVDVDVTARWRIENARKFRETIGSIPQASTRLQGIINDAVKAEIASHDLYEVVRSSNRVVRAGKSPEDLTQKGEGEAIDVKELQTLAQDLPTLEKNEAGRFVSGRSAVLDAMLETARGSLQDSEFGIHLEDILIKQLTYTKEIEANVYKQMNAELQKIASGVRSRGRERAETKLGEMERKLDQIESAAERRAKEIRGEAEAKAIRITAEAYGENPEFFRFLRGLETYQEALGENHTLILGTDTPLFRLLERIEPGRLDAAAGDGDKTP